MIFDAISITDAPLTCHLVSRNKGEQYVSVKNDAESLASAVMFYGADGYDVSVENIFGELILKTFGFFVDRFFENNSKFSYEEFLDKLMPMQKNGVVPSCADGFIWDME